MRSGDFDSIGGKIPMLRMPGQRDPGVMTERVTIGENIILRVFYLDGPAVPGLAEGGRVLVKSC